MTDDASVRYALHRKRLAERRLDRWNRQAQALEDRRDATKSKGWRTRLTRELDRADAAYRRAAADTRHWNTEIRQRLERDRAAEQAQRLAERQLRETRAAEPVAPDDEDMSVEWEVGVDYESDGGAGSNVDINIRLRRTDGRQFGFAEATRAMSALRQNVSLGRSDPAPPGYEIAGIAWQNPDRSSRGWRRGEWDDLGGLLNVLYVASDAPDTWRLGSVDV